MVQLCQLANKINLLESISRYINYLSITAIKKHDQKQLIKRDMYLELQFQRDKSPLWLGSMAANRRQENRNRS